MSWNLIKKVNSWKEFVAAMAPLRQEQRGKAFELLTELFLQINPIYRSKLKDVWHELNLPPDVRHKLGLPSPDIGVDLIAETTTGEFWAIQCKYHHDPARNVTKNELNSFIDVSTRICKGKFGTLLAVSSAHDFSVNLQKYAPEVQYCLSNEFQSLDADFFIQARAIIRKQTPKLIKRIPRLHQKTAIKNAVRHFVHDDEARGKLIHPCGTGKSLIGYWIAEALGAKTIIVALPSLYLVRQTLADWTRESLARKHEMDWMVVCSEATIGDAGDPAMRFQEMGLDVTTDVDRIATFLRKRVKGQKVVFTTYQSGEVTARAVRKAQRIFNVGIFDEAHRTVGQKDSMFSHLLDEKNIRIKRRVFMTATERRYQGSSDTILSMGDVDAYGGTFDRMTFKEALEQKPPILSDYKIITMVIGRSEIQHLIDDNFLVKPDKGRWDDDTEARTLASLIALRKVMKKHRAKHALTFHNSIAKAEAFKESQEKFNGTIKGYGKADCYHVSSKISTGDRKAELERFRLSHKAIITNAKCLTEGVDVPTIDAVLFADTKRSTVDIVQAAGRALRPAEGKKRGYIIVPVLVDENDPEATDKAFQDILMTLRAMASNDDRIIDYFRSISQGKRPSKSDSIVDFEIPDPINIDFDDFVGNIETQVWHRLAKISWRPFEQARVFARSLDLKSVTEWRAFTQTGKLPPDIPAHPRKTYQDKGWVDMGDWLGTGNVASWLKVYRPFKAARAFARSLDLKSSAEWIAFTQTGKLPPDIPASPPQTYYDKGWLSWGDWLGTGNIANQFREFRPFKEAQAFSRGLNLKGQKEWQAFAKSGKLSSDIPTNPNLTYQDKGWAGWGDWLGSGNVATQLRVYRPFKAARAFAQSLKLEGGSEWRAFTKSGKLPSDIPAYPDNAYQDKGWAGWGDWVGTGNVAAQLRVYRPFKAARAFARSLHQKSGSEWYAFTKTGKLPSDIPTSPRGVYKDKGWLNWGDWLGTGNVAPQLKVYRPFKEARAFAQSLKLKNRSEPPPSRSAPP
jgi:superfamily II DNA or RNA helicase